MSRMTGYERLAYVLLVVLVAGLSAGFVWGAA